MTQTVYKVDDDFYVLWSSVVDWPIMWGGRKEVEDFIVEERLQEVKARAKRLMEKSDSPDGPPTTRLICADGLLPMDKLRDFVLLLQADRKDRAKTLLQPFPTEPRLTYDSGDDRSL